MSTHAFRNLTRGTSYLSLDEERWNFSKLLYVGRHSMSKQRINRFIFGSIFILLSILYSFNNLLDKTYDTWHSVLCYITDDMMIILMGCFYVMIVAVALFYKYSW
jgi:hypothetical protein